MIGRYLPGRVVQDDRRDLPRAGFREQAVEVLGRNLAAEPTEARDEDELKLRDDGPGHTEEEVVEAAVLEVVLDPGATDPADTPVHEHNLAVVDMAQAGEVPVRLAVAPEHPGSRPRLRRADDTDFDAGRGQPPVVLPGCLLRRRPLPVDHEAHPHTLSRLADQHVGEAVADHTRTEAELVDVHGCLSGLDVREHGRIEDSPSTRTSAEAALASSKASARSSR